MKLIRVQMIKSLMMWPKMFSLPLKNTKEMESKANRHRSRSFKTVKMKSLTAKIFVRFRTAFSIKVQTHFEISTFPKK